ncbi:hypothetical protein T310_4609 [Rasamsonia emersonii CBS 393.64]|uniref:Sugar phosphate transporter domain-containing protein n=1 Tax=Rasamsonia emersonii (strain ATCC 16479 / CBS 393.64 / IMI 116815) TaxID=1408163 RepID=A0A0F4YSZ4_RASE3|nr:hypothetical protein T310_4609 [Rasamsonia emersonii CBS 393.64]KKA21359.1 hypothetical protein T310_4609 [Rasamsonia emersonii CBS 393.64]
MSNPQPLSSPVDKFPSFVDEASDRSVESGNARSAQPLRNDSDDLWQPRKAGHVFWEHVNGLGISKHRSRKSISEAISTIRTRNASMSANAHELAEALRAPISYRLIGLCLIWYMTSALTNTSSKSILNALPKPITLTIVQFAFVSIWCLLLSYFSTLFPALKRVVPALKNGILPLSREVITTALPLAIFQLAGHILSSMATSQIPVSLVHTIKGLSPLFTVLAYRIFFRIKYARATYLSLIPLTVGVMLACSTGFSTNFFGILCALCAALVFVSQNIFSKKLFNEASRAESEPQPNGRRKLDKLNLLYYCSGMAFLLTLPIWFISEGYQLAAEFLRSGTIALSEKEGSLDHGALLFEFIFNGLSHFAQNILAFVLLSMISPVSYSVASLIKRVFVIVVAIVWFGSSTTPVQALGIVLTFIGLYLYDRNSHDDIADQRANADRFRSRDSILPLTGGTPSKPWDSNGFAFPAAKHGDDRHSDSPSLSEQKKEDDRPGQVRVRGNSLSRTWLPPGTKQETTWQPGDSQSSQ